MSKHYYTNEQLAAVNQFLCIEDDDDNMWSSLSDYDEFSAARFSPHPEESRLRFFKTEGNNGSDYYSDGLRVISELENDNGSQYTMTADFAQTWEDIFNNDNSDGMDLKSLDAEFYRKVSSGLVKLAEENISTLNMLLDENDDLLFKQQEEDMVDWIGRDLKGYNFDLFSNKKWFNEDDEFEVKPCLAEIKEGLMDCVNTINESSEVEKVISAMDALVEFFTFQTDSSGYYEVTFQSDDKTSDVIKELFTDMYFGLNPNVQFVSLYDHSGMCLQWGSGCRWDSTGNAAIILASDSVEGERTQKQVFDLVNNLIAGNIWYAKQYQLITEENRGWYNPLDIETISLKVSEADREVLELMDISRYLYTAEIEVIEIDSCGGFVCDYKEWDDIASNFSAVEHRRNFKMTLTEETIYTAAVNAWLNVNDLPEGIEVYNVDGASIVQGNDKEKVCNFVASKFK